MSTSDIVDAPPSDAPIRDTKWFTFLITKPLPLILLLQAATSLALLHNTAFEDEALYVHAGTQILRSLTGGPRTPSDYTFFFSGYPYFFPLLAGVLNQFGGLQTVRLFSLACMLVTTACVYFVSRRLYTPASAYAAACLFACAGPTLYLSLFATFDALAVMLVALATAMAALASETQTPGGMTAAAGVAALLVFAVAAKYAALLFVPFVIAFMLARAIEHLGWRRALLLLGVTLGTLVAFVAVLAFTLPPDVLHALRFTTTNRTAILRSPISSLLSIILSLGGYIWAMSLIGLIFSPKRLRLVTIVLFVASLAAPAYHLYSGETVSLHKHIDFGLFFAAPMAGYMVTELVTGFVPRIQTRIAVIVILLGMVFISGAQNAMTWYHIWPDATQLVSSMRAQIRAKPGRYLCLDSLVVEYYLDGMARDQQYTGRYVFAYTTKRGHNLTGLDAYKAAIGDGYFTVIELRASGGLSGELVPVIAAQPQYHLVAKIPYFLAHGSGYYVIWIKG
ncbi:MAG TPA: glycosyltransferase family 39 protein [Ktedonobacterales bacterium]